MKTFNFITEEQDFRTSEAYKTLRTNLTFCGDDVQVIAVTSCLPNDGKSSVSKNIAVTLAEAGKRVLFIDADLRKSVMLGRIDFNGVMVGLSHLLSGQAELAEAICQSNYKNLNAIFAGSYPPNPAELLGNTRFKNLITMMRKNFDYIIIDTPPLGSVIDSAIVAAECDGTVMVIRSGRVSYKFANRVKEQLQKTGCRILGVVLNGVNMKENSGYYSKYYSSYYNGYYASQSEGKGR